MIMATQNNANGDGIPLGFGMALAQNAAAFERFSNMTHAQKRAIIDGVQGIGSKEEMQAYVNRLAGGNL